MAVFETWLKSDLKKPVVVQKLAGNLFSADNGGNKIGVEIFDDGASASVTGGVTGYIVRDDNATVIVTGTLSGNKASIILPQSAYTVVGNISIVIKVGTTTVGACVGYVYRTTTDTMVDPGHVIPSIEELLAKIAACEQATTNANTAASSANTAASNANEKASLADQKATLANTAATSANNAATSATTAAGNANTAAGSANTAASAANTAATKIDDMTVSASGLPAGSTPTATISEVSGHKHIAFGLVKGDKGNTGDPGKDFHIAKTFSSVSAMMNYTGTDIEAYDFAMIDTGSVQDPDTGKLYCYEPDETPKWQYIGDLSGAQGIKGETGTGIDHIVLNQDYTLTIYLDDETSYTTTSIRGATGVTPAISIGTVTTLTPNQSAYVQLDQSSTAEAPVFNFGIPKGDTGTAENMYGSTIPMSPQDSTKIATAIEGKVDANQGAGNAGKALGIDNTGAVVPVPFSGEDFTGATASTAGVHGYVPAPAAGDQVKFLKGDGSWGNVPNPQVMTGATSSTDGASGLVPAPSAGDQAKVLTGSGDWEVAPGARIVQISTTVTNTSGSYTTTVQDDQISADMKALSLEIASPSVFNDKITVTTATGSVTLACNDVAGTSVVKINLIKAATNTSTMTSEEFDILDAAKVDKTDFYASELPMSTTDSTDVVTAIGAKQNASDDSLTTTAKTVVGAINENASGISTNSQAIAKLDSNVNRTNDILASALTCTKTTFFAGSGGSYTGSIPSVNYGWATFIVNVRDSIRTVLAFAPQNTVATNTWDNNAWSGWKELVTNNVVTEEILGSTTGTGNKTLSKSYKNYRYILLILFGADTNTIYPAWMPSNLFLPSGYRLSVSQGSSKAIVHFTGDTTVNIIENPNTIRILGVN